CTLKFQFTNYKFCLFSAGVEKGPGFPSKLKACTRYQPLIICVLLNGVVLSVAHLSHIVVQGPEEETAISTEYFAG
ncbi:hypothetical protein M1146_06465, partial [Patescibacteria group bacterium]|nr:hypothetical protein [Patescibacteria group bacterium]